MSILGRTEKKAERLARQILDDTIEQALPVGASLPNEAAMLAHYGVGRITLREALRMLEVPGLLRIRPGPSGGPVVGQADSRDYGRMSSLFFRAEGVRLVDLMEARALMEVTSAGFAAQHRNKEGIERLRDLVKVLEAEPDGEDNAAFLAASRDFHDVVNSMSGNPVIDLMSSALVHMVLDRMTGFAYPPAKRAQLTTEHIAIAKAIIRGNGTAAERMMRDHMHSYTEDAWEGWSAAMYGVVSWS